MQSESSEASQKPLPDLFGLADSLARNQLHKLIVSLLRIPSLDIDRSSDAPGATLLTRILCGATSCAMHFIISMTPPLDAA